MTFETPDDVIEEMRKLLAEAQWYGPHTRLHTAVSVCDACEWNERRDAVLEYAEGLKAERDAYQREHTATEKEESR